mgnify:CR=1 FL=1|tara:strand:- start:539 stop:685 length:147 start_codon:yes stop_codon:yes gene_type:complete
MPTSTEEKNRIEELKQDARTCRDPFEVMAELAYENERLRAHIRKMNTA